MKQTLLDIVQDILSSIGGDEVNDIADTEESMAVARLVRDSYNFLIAQGNFPEHWSLFELNATDINTPVIMRVPDYIDFVKEIRYNVVESSLDPVDFRVIEPLDWDDFLQRMYDLSVLDEDEIGSFTWRVDIDDIDILYKKNRAPEFFTSFDDEHVIFDAYDSSVDSFLQKNKTVCFGKKNPEQFSLTNSFVPDLDDEQFNLLFNEAKSQAWLDLKQAANPKAEARSRKGWIHTQNNKDRLKEVSPLDRLPNYGRRV